jgi:hypothetical protein
VLSDGYLTIPTRFLARNASDAEIKTAIGLNGDLMTPPCNITLVRTPGEMILIDVGAGPHYMPGAGKLADNLEAAGIDRNAPGAKRNLTSIRDRLHLIAPGADIASGIRAIDTAGHTAGHISVEIASGNEIALVLADARMHRIVSFAHPEWSPAADHHDPDRAIAARKRLLGGLASDNSLAIGFHLPFPGHRTGGNGGGRISVGAYDLTPLAAPRSIMGPRRASAD